MVQALLVLTFFVAGLAAARGAGRAMDSEIDAQVRQGLPQTEEAWRQETTKRARAGAAKRNAATVRVSCSSDP